MKKWLHNIEKFVDRSIPYLLILLFIIIIIDIFFKEVSETYHGYFLAGDYTIITFFVIDLIFKYTHVRKIPEFLKMYWLDIIAVFPFFLFFRLIEETLILSEEFVTRIQKFLHTGIAIEEESVLIAKEATRIEKVAAIGRTRLLTKLIRPIQRLPRFLKAFSYYEKPGVKRKHK